MNPFDDVVETVLESFFDVDVILGRGQDVFGAVDLVQYINNFFRLLPELGWCRSSFQVGLGADQYDWHFVLSCRFDDVEGASHFVDRFKVIDFVDEHDNISSLNVKIADHV